MKNLYTSMLFSCLVTFVLPVSIYAQDAGGMEQDEVASCEQQAKELGITDQQELADYIEECNSMMSEPEMNDMPMESGSE